MGRRIIVSDQYYPVKIGKKKGHRNSRRKSTDYRIGIDTINSGERNAKIGELINKHFKNEMSH